MATVHNRSTLGLQLRTGHSIGPGETLEVDDADARVLDGHPLLDVARKPAKNKKEGES